MINRDYKKGNNWADEMVAVLITNVFILKDGTPENKPPRGDRDRWALPFS